MTTDRRADVLRDLTCPDCGAPVQALLCGTSPTSDEAVAGLAWASASIEFGASPDLSIEHPAWAPAPEGSTIPDSAPDAEAGS